MAILYWNKTKRRWSKRAVLFLRERVFKLNEEIRTRPSEEDKKILYYKLIHT